MARDAHVPAPPSPPPPRDDDDEGGELLPPPRGGSSAPSAARACHHRLWPALTHAARGHPRVLVSVAAVLLVATAANSALSCRERPFTEMSDVHTLLASTVAGATQLDGAVPVEALSWTPMAPPPTLALPRRAMHEVTRSLVAGTERLSLGVLVLSCGRASCVAPRQRARGSVYNVSTWGADAPAGFTSCDSAGAPGGSLDLARPAVVPWPNFWAAAHPPVVRFIVGAHGMTQPELAVVQEEQALYGDILLLPSGDAYSDLYEKVLHGLVAFSETVSTPNVRLGGFSAVMKTDTDSFVRLPQLLWGLRRLLPTAVDPSDSGRYTDVVWGRFMRAFQRGTLHHDFVGGMGYVLTAGLVQSIVAQMRSAPALQLRSTGGLTVRGLGSAEDLGVSLLVLTRPHVQVNEPGRFHEFAGVGGPATASSLVVHGLKTDAAWRALQAMVSERALGAVGSCSAPLR